jgi:hypothetical protein
MFCGHAQVLRSSKIPAILGRRPGVHLKGYLAGI